MKYDVIIIGAGTTGLSAAMGAYFTDPEKRILVLGQPFESNTAKQGEIINIPGIKKIIGVELSQQIQEQVKELGIDILEYKVNSITKEGDHFTVKTNKGDFEAKAIILAMGNPELKGTIKNEEQFEFKGVSYCAICDGALFRGRKVAIVGYGNVVGRGALFLKKYCRKVTILCPLPELNCDGYYLENIKKAENISLITNVKPLEVYGSNVIQGIKYVDSNGETKDLPIHALFIELKKEPDLSIVKNLEIKTKNGYIVTDLNGNTNVPGLFAAGGVTGLEDHIPLRMGYGYKVGIEAIKFLRKNH